MTYHHLIQLIHHSKPETRLLNVMTTYLNIYIIYIHNIYIHIYVYIYIYIYLLFGTPLSTLSHYLGDSHTNPIFITVFTILISTQDHRKVCNKIGSRSPAKHLVRFELSGSECNTLTH